MKQIYYPRLLEKIITKTLSQYPIVCLSGARQTGKSTLLKHTFKNKYRYISFDDPNIRERALRDPHLFLDECGDYVILDEIQYVPDLFPYIKILVDENPSKKGRFILTGSQQFTLIKNIGETLAGRIALLRLYPLSIVEENLLKKHKKKSLATRELFLKHCIRGSYPQLVIHSKMDSEQWYSSYIETYLERDIRTLYDIGSLREFHQFMRLLAARVGQQLNLSDLSRDTGVSVPTIKRWISILEAGNIIFLLPPFSQNFGKRITKNPKVYFLDLGLVSYLTGLESDKHVLYGPMAGALFENFVIQELIKWYFHRGKTPRLYYMRTHNNLEIDLIIEQNMRLYPVEIKLSKTPLFSMTSSMDQLKKIFHKLPWGQGTLLCLCDESFALTKTTTVLSLLQLFSFLEEK
jgi:uncharacterized protein